MRARPASRPSAVASGPAASGAVPGGVLGEVVRIGLVIASPRGEEVDAENTADDPIRGRRTGVACLVVRRSRPATRPYDLGRPAVMPRYDAPDRRPAVR